MVGSLASRQVTSAGASHGFKLPTLGLNKYQNTNLSVEESNPFKVQKDTEMLLMVREQERDFKNFYQKNQNDALRVFEKGISTKQNRAGNIREIHAIPPKKRKKKDDDRLMIEDGREAGRNKLNIFDEKDSAALKHEQIAKLGFEDNKELMPMEDSRHSSA